MRKSLEYDKKIFNSWAEACINEWKNDGKEIHPLIKELNK